MQDAERATGRRPPAAAACSTVEDLAWAIRYSDPERCAALLPTVEDGPRRRVLEAFLAWREQRFDEAVAQTRQLRRLLAGDPLWSSRIVSVEAGVLSELGLVSECVERRHVELRLAEQSGDRVTVATAVHNLGVPFYVGDPHRAAHQYAEGLRLALDPTPASPLDRAQLDALVGLAVLNLHNLRLDYPDIPMPDDLPSFAEVRERVRDAWPEMALVMTCLLAEEAMDAGRLEEARALTATLPPPSSIRDVVNSVFISRVQARELALDGRADEAVALLESQAERLPPYHVIEVLADLVDVHESTGDVVAALAACRRYAAGVRTVHDERTRTAMQALEVWYRTDTARREAEAARREAEEARAEIDVAVRTLEALHEDARRDALTGVWNRRHLLAVGHPMLMTPGHQVAVVDLDLFKQVNDRFGHVTGDETLCRVAAALTAVCDEEDVVARYGGDEFVVLRPASVGRDLAADLAAVTTLPEPQPEDAGRSDELTTSIGVAHSDGAGWEDTLERADRAMYAAKRAGGGCLRIDPGDID